MPVTIISNDFISLGTITSRTEDASYPDGNVEDYWHLKRRFRAGDVNTNDWLLKFDFLAAKAVVAVVLNDVNFDEVRIQGDNEVNFNAPIQYDSGIIDIALDEMVNRHKVYIPLTGFDYQWMRIFIPASATAVGSYTTKWEVGSVVPLDTITEITKNTYSRTSVKAYEDIELASGGRERVGLGIIGWEGTLGFDMRKESNEASLWALNNMDVSKPLIMYENDGDTSRAHLCLRDDAYEGNLVYHGVASGNTIKFRELI